MFVFDGCYYYFKDDAVPLDVARRGDDDDDDRSHINHRNCFVVLKNFNKFLLFS